MKLLEEKAIAIRGRSTASSLAATCTAEKVSPAGDTFFLALPQENDQFVINAIV